MDNLVSIIVPIYNLENYVAKCLDSILAQTYRNIEVIIIDDGSTDQTYELCRKYEKQDERIHLYLQENQGAAAARKTGVSKANGDYICFVDGDDYMDADMITELYAHIQEADMVTSGCHIVLGDNRDYDRNDAFGEGLYSSENDMRYLITNMVVYENKYQDGFLPYLCNKMFKKVILEQIIDDIDLKITYGEDRDLLFRYIMRCESIYVMHKSLYFYIQREGSAVNSNNRNFLSNLNRLYNSLYAAFSKDPLSESLIHQLQMFVISRLYYAPGKMGFFPDVHITRYFLPLECFEEKKKIVLYGAGAVGKDYYNQLTKRSDCEVVLWVDKNWKMHTYRFLPVKSITKVSTVKYDYIVIAIKKIETANVIKEELVNSGIEADKILWKEPVNINMM